MAFLGFGQLYLEESTFPLDFLLTRSRRCKGLLRLPVLIDLALWN